MNENQFETELIQYITSGTITKPEHLEGIGNFMVKENPVDYVVKTKLWKYEPEIKTTEQLWDNFKKIRFCAANVRLIPNPPVDHIYDTKHRKSRGFFQKKRSQLRWKKTDLCIFCLAKIVFD